MQVYATKLLTLVVERMRTFTKRSRFHLTSLDVLRPFVLLLSTPSCDSPIKYRTSLVTTDTFVEENNCIHERKRKLILFTSNIKNVSASFHLTFSTVIEKTATCSSPQRPNNIPIYKFDFKKVDDVSLLVSGRSKRSLFN